MRRPADIAFGDARFLTFSCFRRQAVLSKDRARGWFVDALDRSRCTHGFHLWAWVIKPEHVHLLLWPGLQPARLAHILYTLKKSVSSNRALAFVRSNAPKFLPALTNVDRDGG